MAGFSYLRKGIILFILFTHFFSNSVAQSKIYTLSDLIDSARVHLPLLDAKEALIEAARASITDVKNSYLPKLNIGQELSIGTANDVAGNYLPVSGIIHPVSGGITDQNNYDPQTNNLTSLYAEYELINFGSKKAAINKAKAYSDVQQADFDKTLYGTTIQVSTIYFDVLKNLALLEVDKQNINRYQSVYTIIQALTSSGINAGVDSSLAKAEISKIKVNYNQRSGIINQLLQRLSYYTGIAAADILIDTIKVHNMVAINLYTTANVTNNPLLAYYEKQRELYRYSTNVIKKSHLPKVIVIAGGWARGSSIQYSNNYKSLNNGIGWQRFNYIGGIAITYDLLNAVHQKNKLSINSYEAKAAAYTLQQQQSEINNASAEARLAIQTAEENLKELPVQIEAANQAYQQKVAQYQAGIINLIDLLNASFILYSAQQSYVETLNDWFKANLQNAAATGALDQFIQNLQKQ